MQHASTYGVKIRMKPEKTTFPAYGVVLFFTLTGALLLSNAGGLAAQATQQNSPAPQAGPSAYPGNSTQQPPMTPAQQRRTRNACLLHAGISKDLMNQRQSILRQSRSQIESICGDSSLTTSQKLAQVRQARQDVRKQISEVITPEQEKAIESCQRSADLPPGNGQQNPCGGSNPGNANAPGNTPPNSNPASNSTSQP
jgi:hypothetical protein